MLVESWLEPVSFTRAGAVTYSGAGAFDPSTCIWYLEPDVDVQVGDVADFRGQTRRVIEAPQPWLNAGTTVVVAAAAAFPDHGTLYRPTGGGFDRTTRTYVSPTDVEVWSGPCLVMVSTSTRGGSGLDVAEQVVTTQTLTIEAPPTLTDIGPDDVFVVDQSGDARIIGRRLTVTQVQAGSDGAARTFRVLDNQG